MAQINIRKNRCKGCGLCVLFCPLGHLEMSQELNSRGVPYAREKKDTGCSGCGMCYLICPECCIEIYEKSDTTKK